jgi:hypothetical protein
LAKQNEDVTGVRATVWMVFCFTEQIVATRAAESIHTTSVADSMTCIALRGKYVEFSSHTLYCPTNALKL